MHPQPRQLIQMERQELRMKEARRERESETQRIEKLVALIQAKLSERKPPKSVKLKVAV